MYKNLKVENTSLSRPEKKDGVYISNVNHKNDDQWCIQCPEVDIHGEYIRFPADKREDLLRMFENITERIINLLHTNSKEFFNNKEFSEERIRSSFIQTIDIEDNAVILKNVNIDNNVIVYDAFKEKVQPPSIPFTAVCILKINPVRFRKSQVECSYTITHVKLPIKKEIPDDYIFDDTDEEISHELDDTLSFFED